MKKLLLLLSVFFMVAPSNAGLGKIADEIAQFFAHLDSAAGKKRARLSMKTCKDKNLKAALEKVLVDEGGIWQFEEKAKGGAYNYEEDPRRWYTIHDLKGLKAECNEARKSRFVMNSDFETSIFTETHAICGLLVKRCMATSRESDSDNQNNNQDDSGDTDPDDEGGSTDPDTGGGSNPDVPDNF